MKSVIVTTVVLACSIACSKDKPAETTGTTTTITRGSTDVKQPGSPNEMPKVRDDVQLGAGSTASDDKDMSRSHAVRKHMEEKEPRSVTIIRGLIISDDGEVVTISGIVPDEATHQALYKTARETPNVKGVKDEIKVQKK